MSVVRTLIVRTLKTYKKEFSASFTIHVIIEGHWSKMLSESGTHILVPTERCVTIFWFFAVALTSTQCTRLVSSCFHTVGLKHLQAGIR